jgi:hypothetical protein
LLYLAQLKVPSYPERNFGGNQLLDSSISLSPLYLDLTSDLHVSIDSNVHQGFPWLPSAQEKFAIFRVLAGVLNFRSFSHTIRTELHCTQPLNDRDGGFTFISPYGFNHRLTRTSGRLLGPCFKTGDKPPKLQPGAGTFGPDAPTEGSRPVLVKTDA